MQKIMNLNNLPYPANAPRNSAAYLRRIFAYTIIIIAHFRMLNSNCDAQPIVFVSRNPVPNGNIHYPASSMLPGIGPFSRFSVVGGRLLVREESGEVRVLVDSTMTFGRIRLVDVSDPCVFWDASRIVFSGIEHPDSNWRIYEIGAEGRNFRKITFTDRDIDLSQFGRAAYRFVKYDDIDPCYLPDGRICFASTRYPSLSLIGNHRTTNLYIINPDGTNLHRITTERNGAEEPTIDPLTGKIIFSRWWLNVDMPSDFTHNGITRDVELAAWKDVGNVWWSASIKPDGTGLALYAGDVFTRSGLHSYKPCILNDGKLLGIFIPPSSMSFSSSGAGIRWFAKGPGEPHHVIGADAGNLQTMNPALNLPPFAVDPVQLPDGSLLISYASQTDYGLYTVNLDGSGLQLLLDIPGKLELNAEVLLPRPVPPVIADVITYVSDELPPTADPNTYFKNGSVRFDCANIFTNGEVDQPIPDAPRITRNARIKLFLNFQRTDPNGRDTAILFLNEPIQYTGGFWIPSIPADVPVFDQVVDSRGKVLVGNNGQVAHLSGFSFGRPGTGTKCAGCHAGHSFIRVPENNYSAQFFNVSTSAVVTESSAMDWNGTVSTPGSKVVDRKARNESLSVNWIAAGSQNEFVTLKWEIPIDVQKFILYNVIPNLSNGTNIEVTDCEIFLYYQNSMVCHITSTGPLDVNGTTVKVPEMPTIDEAKVVVKSFTGTIGGRHVAALAEVETIAKISFYEIE